MAFRNSKTLYGEQGRRGRWFGIVETKKSVVIDFANVKFATRSFVDEYYNVIMKN